MDHERSVLQEVLGARYRLGEIIGRGGMAVVYRATDLQLERTVAVKVLSPDLSPLLGRDRFRREIQVAARLQHPGIVPLYESGGSGALLYFTMPLVEGETLRARIDRERQLPVDEALRITLEIADALRHAHAQGVVHRDIKPENILLTGERAQVTDFGIAHAISLAGETRLTSAGMAIGTPAYISPEQATDGATIDGRADVYSLGCLLYEMLSGQPPYTGATAQAVVSRHVADRIPSVRAVRSTVPTAVEEVLTDLLAKVPADRPDAETMISRLHAAIDHPAGRGPGWRRLVLSGVGVAAVLALAWTLFGPSSRPIDDRLVVVGPFQIRGELDPSLDLTLQGLIRAALHNTEPLRWELAADLVDEVQLAALPGFSRASRRDLALGADARWYLGGEIIRHGGGDSLTVNLMLEDTRTGESQLSVAKGAGLRTGMVEDFAHTLVKQALVPVLQDIVGPTRLVELTFLDRKEPRAVTLWLHGEQAKELARFDSALAYYRQALDEDSTLAVAAVSAGTMATWMADPVYRTTDSLARLALRHREGLPTRTIRLMEGLLAYASGDAYSAVGAYRAAIAIDSNWAEPWMMLGDTYYHRLPGGIADTGAALSAFRRAIEIDPDFGPARFHLAAEALRIGDTLTGNQHLAYFESHPLDPAYLPEFEILLGCQRGGVTGVDWEEQARRAPARLLSAGRLLAAGGERLDCARAAATAITFAAPESVSLADRWSAFMLLHHIATAGGDIEAAQLLTAQGVEEIHPSSQLFYLLDAMEYGVSNELARGVMQVIDAPVDEVSAGRLIYLGRWALHTGNLARVDTITTRLLAMATEGGDARDGQVAAALRGRRALALGDTAAAITLLRQAGASRMGVSDVAWGLWESGAAERLLLAELLLATGAPGEAAAIASELEAPQSALAVRYLPAALAVRLRAAERLGQRATTESVKERLRRIGRPDLIPG